MALSVPPIATPTAASVEPVAATAAEAIAVKAVARFASFTASWRAVHGQRLNDQSHGQ